MRVFIEGETGGESVLCLVCCCTQRRYVGWGFWCVEVCRGGVCRALRALCPGQWTSHSARPSAVLQHSPAPGFPFSSYPWPGPKTAHTLQREIDCCVGDESLASLHCKLNEVCRDFFIFIIIIFFYRRYFCFPLLLPDFVCYFFQLLSNSFVETSLNRKLFYLKKLLWFYLTRCFGCW